VAKNVVAAGLAKKCEVQVAYAIGVAQPVGVFVTTFGTGTADDKQIAAAVSKVFDFRPAAIIDQLDLLRPIYRKTAAFGHFGRTEKEFTWERTDRAEPSTMRSSVRARSRRARLEGAVAKRLRSVYAIRHS